MGDFGLKISKPGFNVGTAGLGDLIMQSNFPILKVQSEGTGSISVPNDGATHNVTVGTHSLGYQPLFSFQTQWFDLDSGTLATTYISAPYYDGNYADLGIQAFYKPVAGTSTLDYYVSTFDGSGGTNTLNYKYVIYYDPDTAP